jgi:tripartite-type tricarboxylate transporter receptor subunit TctC
MAPRGTPEPIVARMRQVMAEALKAPDVTEKLRAGDQIVVANTPAEAAAMLAADNRKWGEVVRRIQLGLD